VLIYATGGLAFGKVSSTSFLAQQWIAAPAVGGVFANVGTCCLAFNPTLQSADNWRAGVTFGGGIEVALGARLSIKGEYLYYNFGNWTYDMPQVIGTLIPPSITGSGGTGVPLSATAITATTRNFTGNRWVVGLNYNFGAPYEALDRRP
jgi:opacity protein-like surface antigen